MRSRDILFKAGLIGLVGGAVFASEPPSQSPSPVTSPEADEATESSVYYSGCREVRALGKAPLHADQPGYSPEMDGDGDGIACEPHRR